MLIPRETQKAMSRFGEAVVRNSRASLRRQGKSRSGRLEESIDYDMQVTKNSLGFWFEMEEYGEYQDQGVNGTKVKHGSPFSYDNKRPPLSAFGGRRGTSTGKDGKPIGKKSLQYLISNKIFEDGIKPSLFFTKPFEAAFKQLPDSVLEAFALDTEKFLKSTLKDNKTK